MSAQTNKPALLPAYLIFGEDELKRETMLKRLHARLETMGDLSLNSETFSGLTCSGEAVVAAANTLPFASAVRLVEVHDVDRMKKADLEEVIAYLKAPCATTVLTLVANKMAKNTRLYKAVQALGKNACIDCAPIARKNLRSAVQRMAAQQGITLTPSAAATLIDLVGTNTVALDSEVKKLALAHRGADAVNENEVLSLVSRTAEVKPWELVDAFAMRNAARCIYFLNRMKNVSYYALLAMCTTRIRELLTTQALVRRGQQNAVASTLKLPDWRVKNYFRQAQGFSSQELIKALRASRDTEQAMKTGADPHSAFTEWMLSVCARKV